MLSLVRLSVRHAVESVKNGWNVYLTWLRKLTKDWSM